MDAEARFAKAVELPTGASRAVTVVLVDDQGLIRSAVRHVLSSAGIQVVGEASNPGTGVQVVLDVCPDVVLMEFVFNDASSLGCSYLIGVCPCLRLMKSSSMPEPIGPGR